MTFDKFVQTYLGKSVDYDHIAGVQCVDLVDQYLKDIFGITGVYVNGARDFYNKFNTYPALVSAFYCISNTPSLVTQPGDIVIWGGGTYGHCGIANYGGTVSAFDTYEENTYGRHEPVKLVHHTYAGKSGADYCNPVLGVLRPKEKYQSILFPTAEYKVVDNTGKTVGKLTFNK